MVLGVCHVFWAFLRTSAFSISVFLLPSARFWVFLAFRRPLFDFFPLTHACGISFGEKSQKVAFFRPKKTQKWASDNRKKEMLQASVQKNAPKNTTHPQNHISVLRFSALFSNTFSNWPEARF